MRAGAEGRRRAAPRHLRGAPIPVCRRFSCTTGASLPCTAEGAPVRGRAFATSLPAPAPTVVGRGPRPTRTAETPAKRPRRSLASWEGPKCSCSAVRYRALLAFSMSCSVHLGRRAFWVCQPQFTSHGSSGLIQFSFNRPRFSHLEDEPPYSDGNDPDDSRPTSPWGCPLEWEDSPEQSSFAVAQLIITLNGVKPANSSETYEGGCLRSC